MKLKSKILDFVKGDTSTGFNELALELFQYQSENNSVYKEFLSLINFDPRSLQYIDDIPLLPIKLFKTKEIKTGGWASETVFMSSGSTGTDRSRHFVRDLDFYKDISSALFTHKYSSENYEVLGLLPSYLENGSSSLVCMVDNLMKIHNLHSEAFFMYDFKALTKRIENLLNETDKKIVLIGVSFALLDFCERNKIESERLSILFTGGMKNRRKELSYEEVYDILKASFPLSSIDSEYGMTEMFSQSYSLGNREGIFESGRSIRILSKELNDPLSTATDGRAGQIGFIDLANVDSLAFVLTEDMGVSFSDTEFKILGRLQNSDLRGCNLLYQS